jgi:zinc transporter ZupT
MLGTDAFYHFPEGLAVAFAFDNLSFCSLSGDLSLV